MKKLLTIIFMAVLAVSAFAQEKFTNPLDPRDYRGIGNFVDVSEGAAQSGQVWDGDDTKPVYRGHGGTDLNGNPLAFPGGNIVHSPYLVPVQVLVVRDGKPDDEIPRPGDCGNYIVIGHDMRDCVRLCHLQNGSFLVEQGDIVVPGQPLARLGFSGYANKEHMHVHFEIIYDWKKVCPFQNDLWADPAGIMKMGWRVKYAPHPTLTVNAAVVARAFDLTTAQYVFQCPFYVLEDLVHTRNPWGPVGVTVGYPIDEHTWKLDLEHGVERPGDYWFRGITDRGPTNPVIVRVKE